MVQDDQCWGEIAKSRNDGSPTQYFGTSLAIDPKQEVTMLCSLHVPPEKPQVTEGVKTFVLMMLLIIIAVIAIYFGVVYTDARALIADGIYSH